MKFLSIGLGSMGKRRLRCLLNLGYSQITGIDPRQDRQDEARNQYNIKVSQALSDSYLDGSDAMIISTPPDKHLEYVKLAIDYGIPCFVEASVLLDHVKESIIYNKKKSFVAPSCTMLFHPAIKLIKDLVLSDRYGKVKNFSYHSGQYLPDWHPWEKVQDYYVSNKATGGAREIVPFELTWITALFGFPSKIKGYYLKTTDLGIPIDDTYCITLMYPDMAGTLLVDVISRIATRQLIINLEETQIRWNWENSFIEIFNTKHSRWDTFTFTKGINAPGYNENIGEEMYINEIQSFVKGISQPSKYPNSLNRDLKILQLLESVEISNKD